jgi:hypothetical protein
MTGPEHYQEAERALYIVDNGQAVDTQLTALELLAFAQAHATLALAAATAMGAYSVDGMDSVDFGAWNQAVGSPSNGVARMTVDGQ